MVLPGVAGGGDVEVEWQFDALDLRPVERWLAAGSLGAALPAPGAVPGVTAPVLSLEARPAKRLVDTYLDTPDWRIGRGQFVLRIRRAGGDGARSTGDAEAGGGEVTLKSRTESRQGLRRRLEVTEVLPAAGLDSLGPEGPVGRRLRALAGGRRLEPLFVVRTRRRPIVVRVDGTAVAEIALDDTVIDVRDGAKPMRLQRVEVEVDPRWVDALTPAVELLRTSCGLQPAAMSKFEAGLLGSALEVPSGAELGAAVLPELPSIADVAFVVLRRNLAAMLAHEAGTRLGDDPEELHDMRVATRRMRAALALFADVLPVRAAAVRRELGWLADALGAVRDLDVQIERTEQVIAAASVHGSSALKDLLDVLEKRRQAARERLLASLDSARYERLTAGFAAMLRHGPLRRPGPARAPALLVAPDLVRGRHRAVAKAARAAKRSGNLDDFHRLRIRAKRLRYAVEFVSELYPGETKKYIKQVVRIQDALGSMQDARVAAEQLHALAVGDDDVLSRETIFVLGGLAEHYRHESAALASYVPGHVSALSGGSWRRLIGHMDRKRLEQAPRYGWASGGVQAPGARTAPPQGTGPVAQRPSSSGAPSDGPPTAPEHAPDPPPAP